MGHDTCWRVEERESESFAAATAELDGKEVISDPVADVVRERTCVPPEPVSEEVAQRGVDEPVVLFELTDGVFRDPASEPVMRFDFLGGSEPGGQVRDDRVETPPIEVIEGQLVPEIAALTTHDQAESAP